MKIKSALLFLCLFLCAAPATAAPDIVEVTSKGGLKAWLLRDERLPLISLSFAFRGGVETDPADKQGLAMLASSLLTEGAGPYDDRAFQQKLADSSISLGIEAGRDTITGEIKTLTRTKDEAFRLLSLALTKPRFDEPVFERARDQQLVSMRFQIAEPDWQARYALFRTLFGDHPYAYRSLGATQTIRALTRADMVRFARTHLAKDRLFVAAAGAISPAELAEALDRIFGALPDKAAPDTVPPAEMKGKGLSVLVERDGKQTSVAFAAPMMKRLDPDWQAAQIANYILGGGGFVSRLMKKVREEGGLTYGIGTSLAPMDKASILVGSMASDDAKTAEAIAETKAVWKDLFENGATEDEIRAAKAYLTGSEPLALTSTDKASGLLLSLQLDGLPKDYLQKRAALIEAVTRADVNRVLRAWFDPAQIRFALTGQPENMKTDETLPFVGE